jgi:hypothetical protein
MAYSPPQWSSDHLPVSRAERAFGSGHSERTYSCVWCGCDRLLESDSVSTVATLPRDPCWPLSPRWLTPDHHWPCSSRSPRESAILFYSGVAEAHLHPNHGGLSPLNTVTCICGKATSLGSPHPESDTQSWTCHSLKKLLHQLLSIKYHGSQFILTLGESRFYFVMGHENIWLRSKEQPPERPIHMIQYPKMLGLSPLGWSGRGVLIFGAFTARTWETVYCRRPANQTLIIVYSSSSTERKVQPESSVASG